jgi:hypothetical protein
MRHPSTPAADAGGQQGQIPAAMVGDEQRSSSEAHLARVGLKDKAWIEGVTVQVPVS